MRILLTLDVTPPVATGVGRLVVETLSALSMLDDDFEIVVLASPMRWNLVSDRLQGDSRFRWSRSTTNERESPIGRALRAIERNASVRQSARRERFDVVHVPNTALILGANRLPGFVLSLYDVAELTVEKYGATRTWYRKYAARAGARHAHAVVTISEVSRREVARRLGVEHSKIRVLYPGIDHLLAADEDRRLPTGLPTSEPERGFYFWVGKPLPHKNLERLVQAVDAVRADDPSSPRLVIAGPGTREAIEPSANVAVLGHVTDAELRWLYHHCTAFVFPSTVEGFGFPAFEAASLGAPCVVSEGSPMAEVLGDAALTVTPGDVSSIARSLQIVRTLDRAERAQSLRSRCVQLTWRNHASQLLSVYRDVAAGTA